MFNDERRYSTKAETSPLKLPFVVTNIRGGADTEENEIEPEDHNNNEDDDDHASDDEEVSKEESAGGDEDDVEQKEGEMVVEMDDEGEEKAKEIVEEAGEAVAEALAAAEENVVLDDPSIDDDSSAFVDRMELADAYDDDEEEEVAVLGETTPPEEASTSKAAADATSPGGHDEETIPDAAPAEITKEMSQILMKELKYRRKEVALMRPDIAAIVVSKKLKRPLEGIPNYWYATAPGGAVTKKKGNSLIPSRKIIVPILAVAAVGAGVKSDVVDLPAVFLSLRSVLSSRPTTSEAASSSEATSTPIVEDATEGVGTEDSTAESLSSSSARDKAAVVEPSILPVDDFLPANEHTNSLNEVHPHSIKPGENAPPEDELDVTWLDKLITKMLRALGLHA